MLLPVWPTREIGTYAIGGTGGEYLGRGLTHFAVTWVTLFAVAMAVSAVRLRQARIPVPGPLPHWGPSPASARRDRGSTAGGGVA